MTKKINDYRQKGTNTFEFPSHAEFSRVFRAELPEMRERAVNDKAWTGESLEESMGFAEHGNTACVAEAEKMLAEVEKHIDLALLRPSWEASVCGAFPCVPDYLSGHPESMRRKVMQTSESEPVRIYVCMSSSAGVDHNDLTKRGCAVLALVMALQMVRPVELWTFQSLHGRKGDYHGSGTVRGDTYIKVALSPSPIVMSEAAYGLTSAGFARNMTYSLGWNYSGFNGGWAEAVNYGNNASTAKALAKVLGAESRNDLVIPPPTYGDAIIKTPVKWVLDRLAEYKNANEME